MGKSAKQRGRKSKQKAVEAASRTSLAKTTTTRDAPHFALLPQPFPRHLPKPSHGFLRDEPPYRESFQEALEGPYEGFVVDTADELGGDGNPTINVNAVSEDQVSTALNGMNAEGNFRADVTQPFGLNTKCAKTYVTRCLVGAPGTTYKYLGLRMFAMPFACNPNTKTISSLGSSLSQRSVQHLHDLDVTRNQRRAPPTKGVHPSFNICLINRMEYKAELKATVALPPSGNNTHQNEGKTTVSWHADSSLENFSTIAVYSILEAFTEQSAKKWWVGMRVAHHAEGPKASQGRKGSSIESSLVKETPPIAVSLPSGSAYYMLDDFNHHHQHIVFTTGNDVATAGIRYSATFRQLRQSHTAQYWIERSLALKKGFNRKGMNVWHSEHLVHQELEFEWIRQFYVQGQQHYDLLWDSYWKQPIQELLGLWSCFEHRSYQTVELLRAAAEAKCGVGIGTATSKHPEPAPKLSKGDRKERDRRLKALAVVEKLLSRGNGNESNGVSDPKASSLLFYRIADCLEERAKMREQWRKREKDHVFREMSSECRPLCVPFRFDRPVGEPISGRSEWGSSPFPRSSSRLKEMSTQLRQLGEAFDTGSADRIPPSWKHAVPMDWEGWKEESTRFGLELQDPWANAIVDGSKSIETRLYSLPSVLLGKRLYILQSQRGKAGVSSLGNHIDVESSEPDGRKGDVKVIGWCIISSVKEYTTRQDFETDEPQHLVKPESGYGWKEGSSKVVYGWVVSDYGVLEGKRELQFRTGMRRFRSLFELHVKPVDKSDTAVGAWSNDATDAGSKQPSWKRNKDKKHATTGGNKKKRRRF